MGLDNTKKYPINLGKILSIFCFFSHRRQAGYFYLVCLVTKQKKYIPEYLSFTRKERMGIITVFVLILLLIILPFLVPFFYTEKKYDTTVFEKEITALKIKQLDSSVKHSNRNFDEHNYQNFYQPSEKSYYHKQPAGELFYFDPNTLPVEGWKKLGVREKTARTIHNYISKGGRFNKPEDISKIWGLHKDEVNRLLPYIRIESASDVRSATQTPVLSRPYEKAKSNLVLVDINEADTTAFIALPGIGSKLANRIIAFREKLGGFYAIDQVAETFALPDSTFRKIKERLVIDKISVRKININTAMIDELKAHPYIRYHMANAILQYRTQHGEFADLADLKKIMIITNDVYQKVSPYLILK